jgi:pimeloyl-ACP methyl ester carboxylesterase
MTHPVHYRTRASDGVEIFIAKRDLMTRPRCCSCMAIRPQVTCSATSSPRFQPPLLTAWGRHDPFFGPAGAEAYRRDLPKAEVHPLDGSHFALKTHCEKIAGLILDFVPRSQHS